MKKMRLCIGDQIEINRRFNIEICDWLGDDGIAHAINRIQSLGETEKILHLRLWFGDEEVYWTGKLGQNLSRIKHEPYSSAFILSMSLHNNRIA